MFLVFAWRRDRQTVIKGFLFPAILVTALAGLVYGQRADVREDVAPAWRPAGAPNTSAAQGSVPGEAQAELAARTHATSLPMPSGSAPAKEPAAGYSGQESGAKGPLPCDAGQVWHEYDISAYTARVTSTKRPEQAIVDWILRETGYETWHTEPVGLLSAGNRALRVYHTPEMQRVVADVVDRFTSSEAATYTFSMRVVTLDSPNWRTPAQGLLRSIPVQTPGVNGWVLPKENAAILLGQLRRRSDYREHSSPYLMVNNGQSTVVSAMRGQPYVRDVAVRAESPAGFDPLPSQIDEGFALDFSPLLSADRRMIDAMIKCNVDQVEKMIPVMVDVPTQASPRQRTKIEVPQVVHYRFHERFRWPTDQVLLVGMGMVALPIPVDGAPLVPGVPLPIGGAPPRADLLVFIECKGAATATSSTLRTAPRGGTLREAKNYRGRY